MNNYDQLPDANAERSDPIDFLALQFSDMLALQGETEQHVDAKTNSMITIRVVGIPVRLNDQILLFTMLHQQRADQTTNTVTLETYEFCLQDNEDEDEFVDCTMAVQYKTAEGKIVEGFSEAAIFKLTKNRQGVFSKGIGIQFYRKALDFISSLAIKKGVRITDVVRQSAAVWSPHGRGALTNEQWERTFLPVVNDSGYTKLDSDKDNLTFMKRYEPVAIYYHQ